MSVTLHIQGVDIEDAWLRAYDRLVADGVAEALGAGAPTLWGDQAEDEARHRLGWLDLPRTSRSLLGRLRALREAAAEQGLSRVVLAGMGGSSLAPEVIAGAAGVPLTVLDTTDPEQVARVLADRLESTLVVVSSKSGGTVETDSHRRIYEQAFRDAGITGPALARRFVVVTDPGTPLDRLAGAAGYTVVHADPDVGGRYSALSAFGLVPSALAGADPERLLDEAAEIQPLLTGPDANPGLDLGAVLGGCALAGRDKVLIADAGSGLPGFGDWAEQLLAESTGKQGRGILPVVVEGVPASATDTVRLVLGEGMGTEVDHAGAAGAAGAADMADMADVIATGTLGGLFLAFEYATAVAGHLLEVNPFDQPNVAESKDNTAALLEEAGDGPLPAGRVALVDGAVEVHAGEGDLRGATDLAGALEALLAAVPDRGYLAVMAYLDRGETAAAELRPLLAARTPAPVTFGWGPRFLHSTGQYHKGGPQTGVFLQITGEPRTDVPVPGRPYTLGRLQLAQALGDLRALRGRGRPAVRLHLRDRAEGLAQLVAAAKGAGR